MYIYLGVRFSTKGVSKNRVSLYGRSYPSTDNDKYKFVQIKLQKGKKSFVAPPLSMSGIELFRTLYKIHLALDMWKYSVTDQDAHERFFVHLIKTTNSQIGNTFEEDVSWCRVLNQSNYYLLVVIIRQRFIIQHHHHVGIVLLKNK